MATGGTTESSGEDRRLPVAANGMPPNEAFGRKYVDAASSLCCVSKDFGAAFAKLSEKYLENRTLKILAEAFDRHEPRKRRLSKRFATISQASNAGHWSIRDLDPADRSFEDLHILGIVGSSSQYLCERMGVGAEIGHRYRRSSSHGLSSEDRDSVSATDWTGCQGTRCRMQLGASRSPTWPEAG